MAIDCTDWISGIILFEERRECDPRAEDRGQARHALSSVTPPCCVSHITVQNYSRPGPVPLSLRMALPNLDLSVGHRPSTSYLLSHAVIHPGATHAL